MSKGVPQLSHKFALHYLRGEGVKRLGTRISNRLHTSHTSVRCATGCGAHPLLDFMSCSTYIFDHHQMAGKAQCKVALLRELGLPHDTSTHRWEPPSAGHSIPSNHLHFTHMPPVPISAGKAQCKAALLRELGLPHDTSTHPGGRPLLAIVTRLTEQKGLPLLKHGVEAAIKNGAQVRAVTHFMFDSGTVTFASEASGRCSEKGLPLLKHGAEAATKNGAQVRAFDALVVVYFRSILVEVSVWRSRKGSLLLRAGVEAAIEKGAHVRITAHLLLILRHLSCLCTPFCSRAQGTV